METNSERVELVQCVDRAGGLHARPASEFVKLATSYASDVRVVNLSRSGDREHNAKSPTDLLLAAIDQGHRLRIVAEGVDAEAALETLSQFIAGADDEPPSPG
jgi:phosphotransferase system HPr (HPr) family protein